MSKRLTQAEFIKACIETHGDTYEYPHVAYLNSSTKVTVTCPIHGDFDIMPTHLKRGVGCKQCGYEKNKTITNFEDFIQKSSSRHDSKYDYSRVEYVKARSKVKIV